MSQVTHTDTTTEQELVDAFQTNVIDQLPDDRGGDVTDVFYQMSLNVGNSSNPGRSILNNAASWLYRFGEGCFPWNERLVVETGEESNKFNVRVSALSRYLIRVLPEIKLTYVDTNGLVIGVTVRNKAVGLLRKINNPEKTIWTTISTYPEFHNLCRFIINEVYPPLSGYDINRLVINEDKITTSREYITKRRKSINPKVVYPHFPTPAEMWDAFSNANGRVLLLRGTYGTCKSSYTQDMLDHRGWEDTYIADNEALFDRHDFIDYIRENLKDKSVLVIEDGDRLLQSRDSGNDKMSALLNAVSGIVTKDIRIIITINHQHFKDTEGALMRGGRLFRLMDFKKLSFGEARSLREHLGGNPDDLDDKEYTAGDIFNWDENNVSVEERKPGIGFA